MAKTRDITRRIKSISNTKKITRAMEMVSASKMRKAIEAVLKTRSYANLSWATILNLSLAMSGQNGAMHPLLARRKQVKKVGVVLITSNRGLCGGFNANLMNKVHQSIKKYQEANGQEKIPADFILLGKKGASVYKYFGYNIAADFLKQDIAEEVSQVAPLSQLVIKEFLNGTYDKIMVAYTDYINAAKQIPRVKQLLPIDISTQDEFLGIIGQDTRLGADKAFLQKKQDEHLKSDGYTFEYLFEPSPAEVLDEMLPRLIEMQLYQALLESNASEHSARMNAMHQATEAANDMVSELTLFYNKARQASITAEIVEISAGVNALAE